jgi:hypothetical protein
MSNSPTTTSTSQQALQAMAQQTLGQLPDVVRQAMEGQQGRPSDELGAGITSGFAIVSLRGKVWRIKHRGEERNLVARDPQGHDVPRYSLEIVLVKASENIAKIYYKDGYTEGSTAPPDCWSANGRVPDPAAPALRERKTGPTCVGCWANAWGSRVNNTNGSKGKACADSKRLAIVPVEDIDNEFYGGPMLLRVPPASLGDLKAYADKLNAMGFPYYAVATRVSFDMAAEFPKLIFGAIRVLNADEAMKVLKLRGNPALNQPMDARLERILDAPLEHVETDGVDQSHLQQQVFEQPPVPGIGVIPQQVNPVPSDLAPVHDKAVPPQAAPEPQPAPEPAPAPAPVQSGPLPEGWTELPGGKYYHPMHGLSDVRPTEVNVDPYAGLTKLPDGKYYNPATGQIVEPNGKAPAAAQPEPDKPKRTRKASEPKAPPQETQQQVFEQAPVPQEGEVLPPDDTGQGAPVDFDSMLDGLVG